MKEAPSKAIWIKEVREISTKKGEKTKLPPYYRITLRFPGESVNYKNCDNLNEAFILMVGFFLSPVSTVDELMDKVEQKRDPFKERWFEEAKKQLKRFLEEQ